MGRVRVRVECIYINRGVHSIRIKIRVGVSARVRV